MSAPNDKKLRYASFIVHATRGVLRDQNTRRKTMFILVLVAAAMLPCGVTFLGPFLDPRYHPGWFVLYWIICAWLVLTAVLLALFDLLLVRAAGRRSRHQLEEEFSSPRDFDKEA